jgi:hypothetical protein
VSDLRHKQNVDLSHQILDEVRQVKNRVDLTNGRVTDLEEFEATHMQVTEERNKAWLKMCDQVKEIVGEQSRVAKELEQFKGETTGRRTLVTWLWEHSGSIISGLVVGLLLVLAKYLLKI